MHAQVGCAVKLLYVFCVVEGLSWKRENYAVSTRSFCREKTIYISINGKRMLQL